MKNIPARLLTAAIDLSVLQQVRRTRKRVHAVVLFRVVLVENNEVLRHVVEHSENLEADIAVF